MVAPRLALVQILLLASFTSLATPCFGQPSNDDAQSASAENHWPDAAVEQDFLDAKTAFTKWAQAYQSGDYVAQWRLTDSRIRFWIGQKRWRKQMRVAKGRSGALKNFDIVGQSAMSGEMLPCTEMKHCFRRGVPYIAFLVQSEYSSAAPPQPEYAVMAYSDEGWRFGGGTFPDRPLGETAIIMTKEDEEQYRVNYDNVRRQFDQ